MKHLILPALILSCNKDDKKELRDIQKELFLNRMRTLYNVRFYHLIGDPKLETEYKVLEEDNIIMVKCPDTYGALVLKTTLGFKALDTLYKNKYTHILKFDDDTFIDLNKFNLEIFKQYDYCGCVFTRTDGISAPSGAFYVVSRNAVELILSQFYKLMTIKIGYEDIEIYKAISDIHKPKALNEYINAFGNNPHTKKCFVYHWLRTKEQYIELYNRVNRKD